jgi:hypothetical protein
MSSHSNGQNGQVQVISLALVGCGGLCSGFFVRDEGMVVRFSKLYAGFFLAAAAAGVLLFIQ